MKVLLLSDFDDLRDRLHFALETQYGDCVTEAHNYQTGLSLLRDRTARFDLLVYDLQQTLPEQFKTILALNTTTPIVLCVPESVDFNLPDGANIAGAIERSTVIESLIVKIAELIEKKIIEAPEPDRAYCRIRTKLLLAVCPLKSDIYIRLSEVKFVKLFKEGDVFERSDMEKYTHRKGVEYLYLKKEHSQEFVEKYTADLKKLLQGAPMTLEAVSRSSEAAHETIRELGKRMGFTKEVQELAKTQVQLTIKSVGRSPKLADMILRIRDSKGDYIASHSTMCAYLACAIASQMEWGSETTFFKLNLAAFLHDITLHNHELAAQRSLQELESNRAKFTSLEYAEFKVHPIKGAAIARDFSEVPADVDTIIVQHHECPDGSGFPRGLGQTYIAPLSVVFIIAHDLTDYSLSKGPYFEMKEFLIQAREKYSASQFKKVLTAMAKL